MLNSSRLAAASSLRSPSSASHGCHFQGIAWSGHSRSRSTAARNRSVEHDGRPSVKLPAGVFRLEGKYRWSEVPAKLAIPKEIGILGLTLQGTIIESPAWDAEGNLWLKRDGVVEQTEADFLGVKVYAVLEDGIPLWLRSEIELSVSGKNREEQLGSILPQGWKLAAINSPIPVAVDDAGRMKAQVRPGKWIVHVDAFHLDNAKEIRYAPEIAPAVAEELIGFRANPELRMVEILGAPPVDVSQTTFPERWRDLPVYRWQTSSPLRIEERLRGMGNQKPEGLRINRSLWLDDNGRGITFRDHIAGQMQQTWRLDAAGGQDLGSVVSNGQGLLITRNAKNGAAGVEIRSRNLNLEATGRIEHTTELPASGWQADSDTLNVTLNIPPGWRLFALFGADWVRGDWLTAWSLLDLFLLLVFSLAVFRLWGLRTAILALLAFGLSYQEPGAPRYVWLVLLMPLALLRVVPAGWGRHLVNVWKWLAIAALVFLLVPFLAKQVQKALYPQLEFVEAVPPLSPQQRFEALDVQEAPTSEAVDAARAKPAAPMRVVPPKPDSNLVYEPNARIQTGPGVPNWTWRVASFGWNGPVLPSQKVRPILISLLIERALTLLRVVLLLALAYILLNARRARPLIFGQPARAIILAFVLIGSALPIQAQLPDQEMINTLRKRLLERSDAYPHAADIPSLAVKLDDRRMIIDAEVHAAIRTAVPLPGNFPGWTPTSLLVEGEPQTPVRRDDNYLWVVVPQGVHKVHVEGVLAEVEEWQLTFMLKPHQITVNAPGWNVSGVQPDGVPEEQIFFVRESRSTTAEAKYDRQEFQTVVLIERNLQLGLAWQVRTTARRLSPPGAAIALRVPLLSGENVLSANTSVKDNTIEVRLAANDSEFVWESELTMTDQISLTAKNDASWVERWRLVASPVWNIDISGLAPTFDPGNPELVPIWYPWRGESAQLSISRPQPIPGATVTINSVQHEVALGKRQRVSRLDLAIKSSLGEDFLVELPADAEVTTLTQSGRTIPVRKDGTKLVVPLLPGEQSLSVGWRMNQPLGLFSAAEQVRLPVPSANIETSMRIPDDLWILWTRGPLRGPAVRFWSILASALIAAWVLGRISSSPLRSFEWMLLAIGLTQVPLPAALAVIGWLFFLTWRGRPSFLGVPAWGFNLLQLFLIALTAVTLAIFVTVVAAGLLGSPEMFILGNGSDRTLLRWYQARSDLALPTPGCFAVSIWWYRILMLAWALWLAASLIRWLRWAWNQFSGGGYFRKMGKKALTPPPIPSQG